MESQPARVLVEVQLVEMDSSTEADVFGGLTGEGDLSETMGRDILMELEKVGVSGTVRCHAARGSVVLFVAITALSGIIGNLAWELVRAAVVLGVERWLRRHWPRGTAFAPSVLTSSSVVYVSASASAVDNRVRRSQQNTLIVLAATIAASAQLALVFGFVVLLLR